MPRSRKRLLAAATTVSAFVGLAVSIAAPAAHASTCTTSLGHVCGPYAYGAIPMSNGYNTYISNQSVGATSGTTEAITATNPGSWSITANARPYGYTGVQTYPDVQQLTNNWCGSGWDGCARPTNTPLAALSSLKVRYAETSPRDSRSIYEFAPDVWSNYPSDVMFWADTFGRCNTGAFGGTRLGTAAIDGQRWAVHRYGAAGAEIIFVLEGRGGSGTCARQTAGTINIKAGFDWLVAHRYLSHPVITQLNTGWEITSAAKSVFRMSKYSIIATVKGGPSPSPSSTPVPTRSPTSSAPPPPRRAELRVGNNSVASAADSNPQGTAEAFQYVAQNSFTTATINIYVDSPNRALTGRIGIYTNGKNGNPYQLLGQVKFTPVPGWNRVAMPGVQITVGRRYWLAEVGTHGILAFRDRKNVTAGSQTKSVGSTLPTRWATGGTHWNTGRASFYVAAPSSQSS